MTSPDTESTYARRAFIGGLIAFAAACGRSGEETVAEPATSTSTTTSSSTSTTSSTTEPPATQPPTTEPPTTEPPTTEPPTTEPPATQPAGPLELVGRDAWGAQAPRPGGRAHTISQLTVHHSAVFLAAGDDPTEHLRNYQAMHMGSSGWIDIAYHVAVDRMGTAYELRSTDIAGDTSTAYDPAGHFLVLAIGNFEEQAPSEAQLDGVARVLRWGADTFGVPLSTLTGHRDHVATACPGDALYAQLTELQRRASG